MQNTPQEATEKRAATDNTTEVTAETKPKRKPKKNPDEYWVREGGVIYDILKILSYCGDMPKTSLHLFPSYQTYLRRVQTMLKSATYINNITGEKIVGVLLRENGKGRDTLLRLTAKGKEMLKWYGFDTYYDQLNPYSAKTEEHKDRARRVAEVIVLNWSAGFDYDWSAPVISDKPRLYAIKRLNNITDGSVMKYDIDPYDRQTGNPIGNPKPGGDNKKTIHTRVCGAVIGNGVYYAVYNTRDKVMKWAGNTESRVRNNFSDYAKRYANVDKMDAAIVLAKDYETGMRFLESSDVVKETGYGDQRSGEFVNIFPDVYLVPISPFGVKQYNLFLVYNFHQICKDIFFTREQQTNGTYDFDSDAFFNGENHLLFFDGNIARLMRIKMSQNVSVYKLVIWCFPEQKSFVDKYMSGKWAVEKQERLDAIEEKRKRNFEKAMAKRRKKKKGSKETGTSPAMLSEEASDMCEWMDDSIDYDAGAATERSNTKPAPITFNCNYEIRTVKYEDLKQRFDFVVEELNKS